VPFRKNEENSTASGHITLDCNTLEGISTGNPWKGNLFSKDNETHSIQHTTPITIPLGSGMRRRNKSTAEGGTSLIFVSSDPMRHRRVLRVRK
jgi:hypothetical protein